MVSDISVMMAGLALIAIEVARSLPAYLKVRSEGSSDGLSPASLGILAGTGMAWIILALMVNAWWILAANVLWFIFHAMLCHAVTRVNHSKGVKIAASTLVSIGVLACSVFIASIFMPLQDALSIMLGISVLFYAVPALYEGLSSETTRGLSVVSLSVNSMEGIIYLLAGFSVIHFSVGSAPVLGFVIFGAVSTLSSGIRLIRVIYRRIQHLDRA